MDFTEEGLELSVILIVIGVLTVFGATVFYQFLDKARLTLSVAAMNKAQDTLKEYRVKSHSYPARLDLTDCSDQAHVVVLNCDEIKADIDSFVSYVGNGGTFVLKAKAKDSGHTLITVTESTISY